MPSPYGCWAPLPPPPPRAHGPAVRAFAHCSRRLPGAVAIAVISSAHAQPINLSIPGARMQHQHWLSYERPDDDVALYNGKNFTVSASAPLPPFEGITVHGEHAVLPARAVGIVEVVFNTPVSACKTDEIASETPLPGGVGYDIKIFER